MRILVTDGMDKSAMAALRANGHEVVEQFYEPAELALLCAISTALSFVPLPRSARLSWKWQRTAS